MPRYTKEFKTEAVGQVLERGYSVKEVATRLGLSRPTMYEWIKNDPRNPQSQADIQARQDKDRDKEIARLRAELRRTQEEWDILKKATAYFANQPG